MTNEQKRKFNQGYYDGKNAKTFKNPPHKSWPEKGHFNKVYEKGYFAGWNTGDNK